MDLATRLTQSNLMYRRPDLYDHFAGNDDQLITVVAGLLGGLGSVLDLGCGTGRQLAKLQAEFGGTAVGIDVQDGLVDYGRTTYPGVELLAADLRTARLGREFDLVLCLGNSLSYQLSDEDLRATAATFAAHTRSAGYVLIGTMLEPPGSGSSSQLDDELVSAAVKVESSWDPERRVVTTCRRWHHRNGVVDEDQMSRRVTPFDELTELLASVGFRDITVVSPEQNLVAARKP